LLGQIGHGDVQAAVDRVIAAGRAHGMPLGLYVVDGPSAADARARGFNMIALGTDSSYLVAAARAALAAARGA
ncbi:MAG TPA: aldolase/citrate lyase family protein, partial [Phycisphaerae bacterium]|nr:aldolase/citrate lyase family protein [Phycisphaerae bacterium]